MNIKSNKKEESVNETTNTPAKIFITQIPKDKGGSQGGITIIPIEITKESQNPASAECIKDIGPIDIVYPKENQTVSEDPVCIEINYQQGNYCSVVWSYRLNGGKYSDYNDKAPCLYNLPAGNATFDMRVKSVASAKELFITRNFKVENSGGGSPTPGQNTSPGPTIVTPTPV